MQAHDTPPTSRRMHSAIPLLTVLLALAVCFLAYRVTRLTQEIESLRLETDSLAARTTSIEYNVDHIIPIAENANRWAHCHPDIPGLGCY